MTFLSQRLINEWINVCFVFHRGNIYHETKQTEDAGHNIQLFLTGTHMIELGSSLNLDKMGVNVFFPVQMSS